MGVPDEKGVVLVFIILLILAPFGMYGLWQVFELIMHHLSIRWL